MSDFDSGSLEIIMLFILTLVFLALPQQNTYTILPHNVFLGHRGILKSYADTYWNIKRLFKTQIEIKFFAPIWSSKNSELTKANR